MRRTRLAAMLLLVRVVLALALLPLVAHAAADTPGFEGTYTGTAEGTSTDGKGGSTAVVVWVEDLGESVRFTIEVSEFGIVVSTEGKATADRNIIVVPISVDSAGVVGEGTMTLTYSGENWLLTGVGQGEALSYEGSGSLQAQRVSTGYGLSSLGEQFSDMITSMTGPDKQSGELALEETKSDAGALAPATPEPPLADTDKMMAAGLAAFVILLEIILA